MQTLHPRLAFHGLVPVAAPGAALPGAAPRFSALLGAGQEDAARRLLSTPGARVIHVGNPLRSPLTIERILIQAGQTEVGLLPDDAAEQAMRRLCQARDNEHQVVLVIEQAETLSPGALRILSRLAQPGNCAALHVAFVGSPAFTGLLSHPDAAPVRDALGHPAAPAAPHAPVPPSPIVAGTPPPTPAPAAELAAEQDHGHALAADAPALPQPAPAPARLLPALLQVAALCALGAGAVLALPYALQAMFP